MVFRIAFTILSIIVLLYVFCLIFPIKLRSNQLILSWMIFIVALATMGLFIDPGRELDLYRIYGEINLVRAGNMSLADTPYKLVWVMYWLVSKTNRNGWIVFMTVILWGICIAKIMQNYLRDNKYLTRNIIIYLLAALGGCFVVHLLSGIRCALAAAIWSYAYMNCYSTNKKKYYLLGCVSLLLHSLGGILLLGTLIYEILQKRKSIWSYVLCFGVIVLLGFVLNNIQMFSGFISNNSIYGELIGNKIASYSIRGADYQQSRELLFRIITSIYLFVCIYLLHRKGNTKYEIIGFFILVMYAGYNMSILFERMPYVLGICSLPIINETFYVKKNGKTVFFYGVGILVFTLQIMWGIYETVSWLHFSY